LAPSWVTRSAVCGAPGLSTSTRRARVPAGSPGAGAGTGARPAAEARFGQRLQLVRVMSPETTSAALAGT
jgi:hypothetical protein